MSENILPITDKMELRLFGFRLNPDSTEPDCYTIMYHGKKDQPIKINDQLIFFQKTETAERTLLLSDVTGGKPVSIPLKPDMICDVAGMLYLVTNEDIDGSALILNCLNTLFDLVKSTGLVLPVTYKKILYLFADHLTFHREFGTFLNDNNLHRTEIRDALLWCIGAVVMKSRLL